MNFSEVAEKPGSPEWNRVRDQVKEALVEHGCFEATFDGVPMDSRKLLQGSMNELFELPLETNMRNFSEKPYHGYAGQYTMFPLYERIGIENADIYDEVDNLSKTFWPEGHPGFSKTIQSFSERLLALDQIIRKMILESLGLEKYMVEHISSTYYLLRINKYKGPQTDDGKVGVAKHTDKSMLTILYQNEVEGLEVETKGGDLDSLEARTRFFHCHERDSLHAGHLIKAPDELVDDEHPLLFKPFDHCEFMRFLYLNEDEDYQQFA
ncbi:hypothetical protein MLD38_029650 [Melastoma candidum]|uniref:Uncharacterized protein n=1 Tax=Melastoma candidum TaxID=119954 RepID=A0ACB9N4Q7_9MYRT|nr:hypothetical protein MLD38_029650 [Melastoma candidum]